MKNKWNEGELRKINERRNEEWMGHNEKIVVVGGIWLCIANILSLCYLKADKNVFQVHY